MPVFKNGHFCCSLRPFGLPPLYRQQGLLAELSSFSLKVMNTLTASFCISRAALTRWAHRCLMATLLAPAMPVICNAQPVGTAFVSAKAAPDIAPVVYPVADDYAPTTSVATFPGDRAALQAFLKKPGMYPTIARELGMEGTVNVRFRVLPDGTLTDFVVVQSAGSILDRAALLLVSRMPKWLPAYHDSQAVKSLVVLPVSFQLD